MDRLVQLHLVAKKDEIPSRLGHPRPNRNRNLAGLVYEQVFELARSLRTAEHPRCPTDEVRHRGQVEEIAIFD